MTKPWSFVCKGKGVNIRANDSEKKLVAFECTEQGSDCLVSKDRR
jgi:hypothetical protein